MNNQPDKQSDLYESKGLTDRCPAEATRKQIKNCPCHDCAQFKLQLKKQERVKIQSESDLTAALQAPARKISLRSRLLIMAALAITAGIAASKVSNTGKSSESAKKSSASEPQPESTAQANKTNIAEILQRTDLQLDVARADIPRRLPGLLQGIATVHSQSEHYDPSKPNIYLIANYHHSPVAGDPPDLIQAIDGVQARVMNIIHVLHALGVRRQFMEGIDESIELFHDRRVQGVHEQPLEALPVYRRTGRINRAYIAAEGIYENDLTSLGIENLAEHDEIRRQSNLASRSLGTVLMMRIIPAAASALGIEVPANSARDRNSIFQLRERVRTQLQTTPQHLATDIIRRLVDEDRDFQQLVQALSRREYYSIRGRSHRWARRIGQLIECDRADSLFTPGAHHIQDLHEQLSRVANIFVIRPNNVPFAEEGENFDYPLQSWNEDNFREAERQNFLWQMGLRATQPTLMGE